MIAQIHNTSRRASEDCLAELSALLSPSEALENILAGLRPIHGDEIVLTSQATGRIVAVDVVSDIALPRFDNSAVDGFGVHAADLDRDGGLSLRLDGAVHAGRTGPAVLVPGRTIRVLTGAEVPPGVAAIAMEEHTHHHGTAIAFDAAPEIGSNIRRAGEDVAAGTIVLRRGSIVDSRHLAMLAACGVRQVRVLRRLRVGVMSTGNELVEPGPGIAPGLITDSNRPMLLSLLSSPAMDVADLGIAADDPDRLSGELTRASARFDLLISTGGVSGSEADYMHPALLSAGGRCRAMRLALRPGKPISAGSLGAMRVICLPGNPVAALVGYLLFVRPLVRRLIGAPPGAPSPPARTAETFFHKVGRTEFVPVSVVGYADDGMPLLRKLGRGGSARLLPIVQSDGFAQIAADVGHVPEGGLVIYHRFDSILQL
ncbi:molybdopterin molybdotransferase MoeA [Tardiphaga sp. 172_B4_N1_3]|uniref:molybdopterin molybdotransferase MoeA n=1 Tax=Tardiphaga sp. 172_B4_N1_3 TaxID=3240787 RepID=UPI003F893B91